MTTTATAMSAALQGLQQALDASRGPGVHGGSWRWTVRQRLGAVRDALLEDGGNPEESWLAARGDGLRRERIALLVRLGELASAVLTGPDPDRVAADLRRLVSDLSHHLQRVHDLAYDAVELELGGSE